MTNFEAFEAFATVLESNARYNELTDGRELTASELHELNDIADDIFFNPFMFKNFLTIDEEDSNTRHKAIVQDMIARGVISPR